MVLIHHHNRNPLCKINSAVYPLSEMHHLMLYESFGDCFVPFHDHGSLFVQCRLQLSLCAVCHRMRLGLPGSRTASPSITDGIIDQPKHISLTQLLLTIPFPCHLYPDLQSLAQKPHSSLNPTNEALFAQPVMLTKISAQIGRVCVICFQRQADEPAECAVQDSRLIFQLCKSTAAPDPELACCLAASS